MPRTTELKAEEGIVHSPLRRSSRIIAVSSPVPSESKPTRGRRLSTSSENNGSDDKIETKPSRAKRATSITKEDTEPKAETAKPRTRRSSASAEPTVPEEKKQPITRRRSSVTEEASQTAVEPTKGRRNSVTAQKVEDGGKTPSGDKTADDSKPRPITRRRSMSQEISEEHEETKPLTRSRRRSVDRDEVEISEKKITRQRRPSTENLEEPEPKTTKVTPVKNKRRPSVTENANILEPIEELEGERKSLSPVKDKLIQIDLTPVKRKHEPNKADLNLSIINECSFTEGNNSHTEGANSASENPTGPSEEKSASETVSEKGENEYEKNSTASTGTTISESAGTSISESPPAETTSTESIPSESSSDKSAPAEPTSVESIPLGLTPKSITESAKTPPKESTVEMKSITPKKSPRFRSNTDSETVINVLGTENEYVTQKSSLSPSDDILNKSKSNEVIKLSGNLLVVEKITQDPKLSPRKSPRIQAKKEKSKESEKEITQNFVEESQSSGIQEELSKTIFKDKQILLDDSVFDSKVSAPGGDPKKHTTTFISSGSEGSFRFNLSDSRANSTPGDTEDELNSSKISNSSDKENIAVNSDDDVSEIKAPLPDKSVLEESTVVTEKTKSNQAVIVSRVSNVFRPKNINFSFAEPMDVDKTTVDLESSTFEISDRKQVQNDVKDDSIDEDFKLNVSVPVVSSSEVPDSPRGVAEVNNILDENSAEFKSVSVAAEDSNMDTSDAFCETPPVESKEVFNLCTPQQPSLVIVEENNEGVKTTTTTLEESVSKSADENLPETVKDPSRSVTEKSASSPDYDFHLPSDDETETITPHNSSQVSDQPDKCESKEAASNKNVEEDKFVEVDAETSDEVLDRPDEGVEDNHVDVKAGSNSEVSNHPISEVEEISPNGGIEEGPKISDHSDKLGSKEIEEDKLVGLNTDPLKEINSSELSSEQTEKSPVTAEVNSDDEKEQVKFEDITEIPKKCERTSEVENESGVENEDSERMKEKDEDAGVDKIDVAMAEEKIEITEEEEYNGTANSIAEKTEIIKENSALESMPDIEEHKTESNDQKIHVDIEDENKHEKRENDTSNGINAKTEIGNVKISEVQEVQSSDSNSLENLNTEPVDMDHTLEENEVLSEEKMEENNSDSPVGSPGKITKEVKEDKIVDGEKEIILIESVANEDNVEDSGTVADTCKNDDYDEMERSFQNIRNDEDDVLDEDKPQSKSPISKSESTDDSSKSEKSRKLRGDKSVVNEELPEQSEKPKENKKDMVVDVANNSTETITSGRNSSESPNKKKNKQKKKRSIEAVTDDTEESSISDQNTRDGVDMTPKKELLDQSALESKERKNKKKKIQSMREDTRIIESETTWDDSTTSKKMKKKGSSTLADDSIGSTSKAEEPESDNLNDSKISKKRKKKKVSEYESESVSKEAIENVEGDEEAASTNILDVMKIEEIDQTKKSTKKKSKLRRSRDTAENIGEGDSNTKLDAFLKRAMSKSESHSSEEDEEEVEYASEEEEEDVYASNIYIDTMAEEGEEDTPSDDSNDIIDEGESINTTESERDTDDDYDDDDSFICDDQVEELLSGDEYDLGDEMNTKNKKSRIINVEECDGDIIKIDRKEKPEKPKRRSRIVSVSSEDEEDNLPEEVAQSLEDEPAMELKDEEPSEREKKRKSSITIIQNINVNDIKDVVLSDRLHSLVDHFRNTIPQQADVSMNLSLEYAGSKEDNSSKLSAKSRKKNKSVQRSSLEASEPKTKLTKDAKRSSTSHDECSVLTKKPRLSTSFDDVGDLDEAEEKLNKRKRRSTEELNIKKSKKKKKSKAKKGEEDSQATDTERSAYSEDDLRTDSFSILNQLVTDPKNRPRRTLKPSTTKGFSGDPWIIEPANVKPSTSIVSQREIEDYKSNKIHPKDFRNQRLFGGSSRVKRIDTRKLLMKKGFYD